MNRRDFIKEMAGSAAVMSMMGCRFSENKKPNIVYILADDLGIGDLKWLNPDGKIPTPNLDKLAVQGMILTNAHSGSAVCTPTRYGLLTGRHSWRSTLKEGVLWGYSPPLIAGDRLTVAGMLKQAGYVTGCVGKWHLGWNWARNGGKKEDVDYGAPIENGPVTRGFDYFFGIPASLDMDPYVYVENDRITAPLDRATENPDYQGFWRHGPTGADFHHETVLQTLTEKSIQFIKQNQKHPFFLYFPLPAPHTPILPSDTFKGKSHLNAYGDFVMQVDDAAGQLMQTLDDAGLSENTLFIFTSDNGCSPRAKFDELKALGHNPSDQFRGHKADIFEGGHRVPFIARWPGQIKAGSRTDEAVCLTDLMATCADLMSLKLPDQAGEDSFSMLPVLKGHKSNRDFIIHHSVNGSFAIRQGSWKLILCPGSGGWSHPKPKSDGLENLPQFQLYHLTEDVNEQNNLIETHPEIARSMKTLLAGVIEKGRSNPGAPQTNDGPYPWRQLKWMEEEIQ